MSDERRQFQRVPQAFDIQYRLAGQLSSSWHTATTLNLSAAGVRFICDELLEEEMAVEIQLQLPNAPQPLILGGRVAWGQLQASGVCEVGVAFLDLDADEQLRLDALVQFLRKSV